MVTRSIVLLITSTCVPWNTDTVHLGMDIVESNNLWINYSLKGFSGGQVCWDLHVYGKLTVINTSQDTITVWWVMPQNDMMRTLFVCLCVGYLSVQPVCVCVCVCACVCVCVCVCGVSECICSVFKGRLSQHAAVSGGEKVIHLSPFWFTNALLLCTFSTLPAIYPTEQENTTTWCLINHHFRNTILSTTDQLHSDSLLITFLAPKAQFSFMQSFYALSLTHRKWSNFGTVHL